jgi:hypothetical protein
MDGGYPSYSVPEYRKYAPKEFRRFRIIGVCFACFVIAVIGFLVIELQERSPQSAGLFVIICAALFFSGKIIYGIMSTTLDSVVGEALMEERAAIRDGMSNANSGINIMKDEIKSIKSKGHVVMAGDGAIVVIDSAVSNSFNHIRDADPVLAEALETVSGIVENSGNKEAGQAWARFLKELSTDKDKSVLSALWEKIVKLVPDVAKLVESAAKIVSVFL